MNVEYSVVGNVQFEITQGKERLLGDNLNINLPKDSNEV